MTTLQLFVEEKCIQQQQQIYLCIETHHISAQAQHGHLIAIVQQNFWSQSNLIHINIYYKYCTKYAQQPNTQKEIAVHNSFLLNHSNRTEHSFRCFNPTNGQLVFVFASLFLLLRNYCECCDNKKKFQSTLQQQLEIFTVQLKLQQQNF